MDPTVAAEPLPAGHHPHLIPWWLAIAITLPVRRWFENPETLLGPLIPAGGTVIEVGPGAGFFTSALAKAVGPQGLVHAVELQEPLRQTLGRRLEQRGLATRVRVRACRPSHLDIDDLEGTADIALAVNVLHEMPAPARAVYDMARALRPGGQLLIIEPSGHCPAAVFQAEQDWAVRCGLQPVPPPPTLTAGRRLVALFFRPVTA